VRDTHTKSVREREIGRERKSESEIKEREGERGGGSKKSHRDIYKKREVSGENKERKRKKEREREREREKGRKGGK
jgi:hypothetical protein